MPSWISILANTITYSPDLNSLAGTYSIQATITDDNSIVGTNLEQSASCTFSLVVSAVVVPATNSAPSIGSGCDNISVPAFSSGSNTLAISDVDSFDTQTLVILANGA